ncbi:Hypothetical protein PBC10988_38930 [Planctomycetales bacterium 10988]|nr:Hypothetical protein PBC10988_38930 [Planctomycetales bacterium 10988]
MLKAVLIAIDHYRHFFLVITLLSLLLAVAFLPRLRLEDSPERWMPKSSQDAYQAFQRHFESGDTIGIGIHYQRSITAQDDQLLARLHRQLSQIEGMQQVYDASLVAEIEGVSLTDLLTPQEDDRFKLYDQALWDQTHEGLSDRTLLMICELQTFDKLSSLERNNKRREIFSQVQTILADTESQPAWKQVRFYVTSSILIMIEMEKRARRVAMIFLPLSLGLGMLCLLWGFQSWRALGIAVLGSAMAIVLVLGGMGLFGVKLGIIAITAPTLISIIAVATTVHFAAYAADDLPGEDDRFHERLIYWVGVPCLGAAATTAIGFLMLAFNELQPIQELGFLLFAGTLLAFFSVFLITRYFPIRIAHKSRTLSPRRLERLFGGSIRYASWVNVMMLLLVGLLVYCAWPRQNKEAIGLRVDGNPFSFFAEDQEISQALNHLSDRKLGLYPLEVILIPHERGTSPKWNTSGDATYQANHQAVEEFIKTVTEKEALGVRHVISTHSFLERQRQFFRDLIRTGQEGNLFQAWARMQQVNKNSEQFLNSFRSWSHDKENQGAMRLSLMCLEQDAEEFARLVDYVEKELPRDRFDCSITGAVPQIVHLSNGLVGAMIYGLATSFFAMAGLCLILFRSPRLALIAFLPNALPLVLVFGGMGLFRMPISSGSAMVVTVALGIALNDTIHFVLHYRQRTRRAGSSVTRGLIETLQHVGRPILLTSFVHLAGFSIFWLPDLLMSAWSEQQALNGFLPLYHFGLLGSVAMIGALIGDLVLLPALIQNFDLRKTSAVTQENRQPLARKLFSLDPEARS